LLAVWACLALFSSTDWNRCVRNEVEIQGVGVFVFQLFVLISGLCSAFTDWQKTEMLSNRYVCDSLIAKL